MGKTSSATDNSEIWNEALDRMLERVHLTLKSDLDGFPHIGDPETGKWTTSDNGFWTGGFWIGMLWLAHRYTGDSKYERAAEQWLRRLSSRIESQTVFRGLLFYPAAVVGAELTGNFYAREVAIQVAHSLAKQISSCVGIIPLGKEAEEAHTVGDDDANIDGIIAAPLMLWAAKTTDDRPLRDKALSHALKSAEFFVQADNSVIQSATFDSKTGVVTRRYTHKGIADDSIWTRAQAWAMLGFSLSANLEPEETNILELSRNVSSWWIDHIPNDKVAYWDFSASIGIDTWRDTSGTAIAAASLLRVAEITGDLRYAVTATETVQSLIERHLTPVGHSDTRPAGILADGCFDVRHGVALSNQLIWGDYFLFEALGRLTGRLGTVKI